MPPIRLPGTRSRCSCHGGNQEVRQRGPNKELWNAEAKAIVGAFVSRDLRQMAAPSLHPICWRPRRRIPNVILWVSLGVCLEKCNKIQYCFAGFQCQQKPTHDANCSLKLAQTLSQPSSPQSCLASPRKRVPYNYRGSLLDALCLEGFFG